MGRFSWLIRIYRYNDTIITFWDSSDKFKNSDRTDKLDQFRVETDLTDSDRTDRFDRLLRIKGFGRIFCCNLRVGGRSGVGQS